MSDMINQYKNDVERSIEERRLDAIEAATAAEVADLLERVGQRK